MANEIKEILDIFYNEYPKEEKQLEDYITNLQEEKDDAVQCLKYYEEKHFIKPAIDNTKLTMKLANAYMKDINNLQKENDNLKKQYAKEEKKLFHDNEILQQQIDKAVEYIINHTQSTAHLEMDTKSIKHLLNILRGDE